MAKTLLILSWLFDGILLMVALKRVIQFSGNNPQGARWMAIIGAVLAACIGVSTLLVWNFDTVGAWTAAILISGWPFFGGVLYGVLLLVMVGSKARWN